MIDTEQINSPNPSKEDLEKKAIGLASNIFSYIAKGKSEYEVLDNMKNFQKIVSEYYGKEDGIPKRKQRIQYLHRTLDKYVQAYVPGYENKERGKNE